MVLEGSFPKPAMEFGSIPFALIIESDFEFDDVVVVVVYINEMLLPAVRRTGEVFPSISYPYSDPLIMFTFVSCFAALFSSFTSEYELSFFKKYTSLVNSGLGYVCAHNMYAQNISPESKKIPRQ